MLIAPSALDAYQGSLRGQSLARAWVMASDSAVFGDHLSRFAGGALRQLVEKQGLEVMAGIRSDRK